MKPTLLEHGVSYILREEMTARLMTKKQAAEYCCISPSRFTDWIKEGRISPSFPGTHRWDKAALDRDLDKLSGIQRDVKPQSALEIWKATRDARRA